VLQHQRDQVFPCHIKNIKFSLNNWDNRGQSKKQFNQKGQARLKNWFFDSLSFNMNFHVVLTKALAAWSSPDFGDVFKRELRGIDASLLPLQEGLSQTSYVCDGAIEAVILNIAESENGIRVKAGIFYSGINAGSCCADDPTPVSEQTEYCEMQLEINKSTAETTATLIK